MAVAPNGDVYVADTLNYRIQRFDAGGTFQSAFGSFGSGDGQLNVTSGLAVAPDGDAYVIDFLNRRIQRFDASGTFEAAFGSSGSGNGQFQGARGVAVAPGGDVYVGDSENNRVQVFGTILDPALTASFSSSGVVLGQGSTLTLRLTNPNAIPALTGVGTGVSLPAGLARAGAVTNNCGGTVSPSGATVSIAGMSLAPKASCGLRIPVTTQATGSFTVTTEVTTSTQTERARPQPRPPSPCGPYRRRRPPPPPRPLGSHCPPRHRRDSSRGGGARPTPAHPSSPWWHSPGC